MTFPTQLFYRKDGTDYIIEYFYDQLDKDGFTRGFRTKGGIKFNNKEAIIDLLLTIFEEKSEVVFSKKLLLEKGIITQEEPYTVLFCNILKEKGYIKVEEKKGLDRVTKQEFKYNVAQPGDKILAPLYAIRWRKKNMRQQQVAS